VDSYLDVVSALGVSIRTTKRHWDAIVKKHESLADLKREVEATLRAPRYVRLSKEDPRIFLYYAPHRKYFLCVVCRHLNGRGFLVTAYLADRIKKGITIYEAHPDHL
jgi:hypothetical protein